MKFASLFLGSLLYIAVKQSPVNSLELLSVGDFDLARSAILSVAKDINAKRSRGLKVTKSTGVGLFGRSAKGWSFRRLSKYKSSKIETTTVSVTTKVTKTTKPRNFNKFNEVMDQVERAMAQAQLSRASFRLTDLKKDINSAVNQGNVRFARRALGLALYTVSKSSSKSRRGKRSAANVAKTFLAGIKKDLGDDKFSDFLALQGEVTLMYAVDITGSMRGEINASKAIVTEITKYDRSEPVDYILSSFGDPITQGSVVYKPDDKVDQFIQEVGKLSASGGGDCAEYAFEGMINALYEDPRYGSPLYVFTDAPPKDATEENKETLKVLAEDLGVTINFFAGKACKQPPYKFEDFKEVAESNGGQFLELKETELKSMAGFTGSALGGSTAVVSGTNKVARKKRSTTVQIAIPVDNTVSKLVVTITTANHPKGISLIAPTGRAWTRGRTLLTKVLVYNIDSPIKGIWKLLVPSSVGKYEYSAKVTSPENIDFEHYYTKHDNRKLIHVRSPLAGELANVNLTVSGVRNIQKNSLSVDIIDISGTVLISNRKLTSLGKSGLRFTFSFQPPNKPFKLMLKGKTKKDKIFQRISRHVDGAKSLVLKEFYNSRHYTIKRGGSTFIMLYVFNSSRKDQSFKVRFKDTLGYRITLLGRQNLKVRARRKKFLRVSVRYSGGKRGEVGQTENVIIIIKGNNAVSTEVVPLMIV